MSDATGLAGQVSVGSQSEMQPQVPGGMQVRSPLTSNLHMTIVISPYSQQGLCFDVCWVPHATQRLVWRAYPACADL
jgi:hypothetical protein